MRDETMLSVRNLHAAYGESQVLHGVSFEVKPSEVVTLLGRNGAGKTTTLRSIMGIVNRRKGSIAFRGQELLDMPSHRVPRLGIGYVPEERGIFSSLTVKENLFLPPVFGSGGMATEEILKLFPNLRGRDGTQGTRLSGGEQQMLAIARVLRTGAQLILLDEPTEGLAPVIIDQIAMALRALKERGLTILLVEQNFAFAKAIADRHYVVEEGRIVDMVAAADVQTHSGKLQRYLGI